MGVRLSLKIFKCALEGKPKPEAYCRPKKILPKEKTRKTVKVGITKELVV